MLENDKLIKEVSSNLTQITDYLESVGPNGLIDHLSAVELNIRYVETLKLLIDYATLIQPIIRA